MLRGCIHVILVALAIAYFSYHLLMGERGFTAFASLSCETREAEATLAGLRLERERLDDLVRRLKGGTDLDLLDERVRNVLHWSHPGDILVVDAFPESEREEMELPMSAGPDC